MKIFFLSLLYFFYTFQFKLFGAKPQSIQRQKPTHGTEDSGEREREREREREGGGGGEREGFINENVHAVYLSCYL